MNYIQEKCKREYVRGYNQGMRDALELLRKSAEDCLDAISDDVGDSDEMYTPDTETE